MNFRLIFVVAFNKMHCDTTNGQRETTIQPSRPGRDRARRRLRLWQSHYFSQKSKPFCIWFSVFRLLWLRLWCWWGDWVDDDEAMDTGGRVKAVVEVEVEIAVESFGGAADDDDGVDSRRWEGGLLWGLRGRQDKTSCDLRQTIARKTSQLLM